MQALASPLKISTSKLLSVWFVLACLFKKMEFRISNELFRVQGFPIESVLICFKCLSIDEVRLRDSCSMFLCFMNAELVKAGSE